MFDELKKYLSTPPILAKPLTGESLFLYLVATEDVVSDVLVRDANGKQPVYYVSKSLLDAETRYLVVEKLTLVLVTAARKLRPYFQSHSIIVMTTYPLQAILHSLNLSDRLTRWVVELSEFDIEYRVRTSLKSQIFADFVAELTPDPPTTNIKPEDWWTLMVNEASNVKGSGVGVYCRSLDSEIIEQSFRLGFNASNNDAEYEALIAGLRLAKTLGADG